MPRTFTAGRGRENASPAAISSPAAEAVPTNLPLGVTKLHMQSDAGACVLGVGGESKAVFCLRLGHLAVLSATFDRLNDPVSYRAYSSAIERVSAAMGWCPAIVAHDLHPRYQSTCYAMSLEVPRVAVQHHHAHVAAVMADQGVDAPVVGLCCDGVGLGTDGAAWGCEVLYCTGATFDRLGHLEYFQLVGGDAAAIENWRPAAALLRQAHGASWRRHAPVPFQRVSEDSLTAFDCAIEHGLNAPITSSLGRVFDGVSFLLGLSTRNDREGAAAVALEQAAAGVEQPYPYETMLEGGHIRMSMAPIVRALVHDIEAGEPAGRVSARFHETIARMLSESALMACDMSGASAVALSGGCFANRRLTARVIERLERRHLRVLTPRRIPFGDAGLALGQTHVALALWERGTSCA